MEQVRKLLSNRPAEHLSQLAQLGFDANIRLMSEDQWVDIHLNQAGLRLHGEDGQQLEFTHPELTVFFSSQDMAINVLQGDQPLIEAVMQGHIRSSGYIVWVFRLLRALSSA